ncbi:MAG: hypothetical protein OQK12_15755 [Motiliproteus sp.]|nr:hypothetical protein [Motiliproteus sp.]MCW9053070.1 hypothetical protein [Motiliproteus sp.]
MDIYLVGGAVRDRLLDIEVYDRDWVVVGASVDAMVKKGYQPVGKEFPVFLHPQTKEEYALARTERKSGHGYKGFEFFTSPDVTLEQDLIRRDLTINAMAETDDGEVIDPFGGQQDLKRRCLRHVSEAFSEDPLRVLRVARFYARLAHLGFNVAPETQQLMAKISASGELQHLTKERVWSELERALAEQSPQQFFQLLKDCQALGELIPEIEHCYREQHPKIDQALLRCVELDTDASVRLAVVSYFLDSYESLESMLVRLKAPRQFKDLSLLFHRFGDQLLNLNTLPPEPLLSLYEGLDLQRRPERIRLLSQCCQALVDQQDRAKSLALQLQKLHQQVTAIEPASLVAEGFKGKALGLELRKRRLQNLIEHPLT